jgi:hypothetical protein
MQQLPDRLTACMDTEMKQYVLTSAFFEDLHHGLIYNREKRSTGYCMTTSTR